MKSRHLNHTYRKEQKKKKNNVFDYADLVSVHLFPMLSLGDHVRLMCTCHELKRLGCASSAWVKHVQVGELSEEAFKKLTRLKHISSLEVDYWGYGGTLNNVALMANMPQLQKLSLKYMHGVSDYSFLSSLSQLRHLEFSYTGNGLTDHDLRVVGTFEMLECLVLDSCSCITAAALADLTQLHRLERLVLDCCDQLGDAMWPYLASMAQLKQLSLAQTKITDAGAEYLKPLQNLVFLGLQWCDEVTPRIFKYPSASVEELDIRGTHEIADLSFLKAFTKLRILSMGSPEIMDHDLDHLADLPLTHLTLIDCSSITNDGLGFLGPLHQLTHHTWGSQLNPTTIGTFGVKHSNIKLKLIHTRGCYFYPTYRHWNELDRNTIVPSWVQHSNIKLGPHTW